MSTENSFEIHIKGYWPPRGESLEQSYVKHLQMFSELGKITPEWQHWYQNYQSVKEYKLRNPKELTENPDAIMALLREDAIIDGERITLPVTGTLFTTFSQPKEPNGCQSVIDTHTCTSGDTRNSNYIILKLSKSGECAVRLRTKEFLFRSACSLIKIWQPRWLTVFNNNIEKYTPWVNGPVIGYMNYILPTAAIIENLSPGWHWEEYDGLPFIVYDEGIVPLCNPAAQEKFQAMSMCIQPTAEQKKLQYLCPCSLSLSKSFEASRR